MEGMPEGGPLCIILGGDHGPMDISMTAAQVFWRLTAVLVADVPHGNLSWMSRGEVAWLHGAPHG